MCILIGMFHYFQLLRIGYLIFHLKNVYLVLNSKKFHIYS
jgi:hypothetical protein